MKKTCSTFTLVFASLLCTVPLSAEEALPWEDARRFAEALQTIRDQHAEPVDDATLITNAIRGMAANLDPYSIYLSPEEYEQARIDALGRYEGIGVEVMRENDTYVIVTPFDGGPAQRAGLLPGDRLLSANGRSLAGLDLVSLNEVLHGVAGTEVRLQVQRDNAEPFDVTLQREVVTIPSVSGEMIANDIAYIRVAQISARSANDVTALLDTLRRKNGGLAGIVFDLRNNAGGVVEGAVDVADLFLDEGVIVSTRGRAPGQTNAYYARSGEIAPDVPMVVLVNAGTASAAEIVAGALQDHGRGLVAGSMTFGKGAVQSMIPLNGGGALKITTAHYRTPSGRSIEHAGIEPDINVAGGDNSLAAEPRDDELVARAMELLEAAHGEEKRNP